MNSAPYSVQSPQVVEGWFHGVTPDAIDAPRINLLADAVQTLDDAGVQVSLATLQRKVKGGPSILSAISRNDNLDSVVQRLIIMGHREGRGCAEGLDGAASGSACGPESLCIAGNAAIL